MNRIRHAPLSQKGTKKVNTSQTLFLSEVFVEEPKT